MAMIQTWEHTIPLLPKSKIKGGEKAISRKSEEKIKTPKLSITHYLFKSLPLTISKVRKALNLSLDLSSLQETLIPRLKQRR